MFNVSEIGLKQEIELCKIEVNYLTSIVENISFTSIEKIKKDKKTNKKSIKNNNYQNERSKINTSSKGLSFNLCIYVFISFILCSIIGSVEYVNYKLMTGSTNKLKNILECYH